MQWQTMRKMDPLKFQKLGTEERVKYVKEAQKIFKSRLDKFSRPSSPYSFVFGGFVNYKKSKGARGYDYSAYLKDPEKMTRQELSHIYAALYAKFKAPSGGIAGAKKQMEKAAEVFGIDYKSKSAKEQLTNLFSILDEFRAQNPSFEIQNYYTVGDVIKTLYSDYIMIPGNNSGFEKTFRFMGPYYINALTKTFQLYPKVERYGVDVKDVLREVLDGTWSTYFKSITGMDWVESEEL